MHEPSNTIPAVAALIALAAIAACTTGSEREEPLGSQRIHTYTAPASGILANAYVIETDRSTLVVDATLTVSDGRRLRALVDSIGKPLAAVFITHGHPDHYNGLTELVAGRPDVPIHATAGVDRVIREWDARKEQQWKGTFGDEWPIRRTFPNRIVKTGDTVSIDGIRFTAHDLGPGESHHDAYWIARDRDGAYAFIGDLVFNGEHSYVSDGHTAAWLANINAVRDSLHGMRLLPGHGPGGGTELFDSQVRYLETYRTEVARIAQGRSALTETEKNQLASRMSAYLPQGKLTFLIGNGADAVATELASPQAKTEER